jgi:hypothetical protein
MDGALMNDLNRVTYPAHWKSYLAWIAWLSIILFSATLMLRIHGVLYDILAVSVGKSFLLGYILLLAILVVFGFQSLMLMLKKKLKAGLLVSIAILLGPIAIIGVAVLIGMF